MTVAGRDAVARADVILTDRLVADGVLAWARPDAEIIDVGKEPHGSATPQEKINRLLVEHALAGREVVRLKGGDSFVFGRGGEEVLACAEASVPVAVIPGVSSSTAVPAIAGIPVTHRGLSQGFTVISGHVPPDHPDSSLDFPALARSGTTLVILMGVRTLPQLTAALIDAGMRPTCPAAVIADGATSDQRVVSGTLADIAGRAEAEAIRPPAITVIGEVVRVWRTESKGEASQSLRQR
jgi:uroporphyrin-III C-methyltransferase